MTIPQCNHFSFPQMIPEKSANYWDLIPRVADTIGPAAEFAAINLSGRLIELTMEAPWADNARARLQCRFASSPKNPVSPLAEKR